MRIPVRWSAHAGTAAPYTIDPDFFARVDWAVKQALSRRLVVVLNMHHYDEIFADSTAHWGRFVALWTQIAEHYKDYPPELYFEPLNEPHGDLDAGRWNRLFGEALAAIRRTNPKRMVVVGPAEWNGIYRLHSLELPEEDRGLIVTVHYYEPFRFTHQGAEWVEGSISWLGTRWQGEPDEEAAIRRDFGVAAAWAKQQQRPLYLGEFGAYSQADMDSRVRYTGFVAREAEARGWGWAYWEFCSGFGTYDPQRGEWRRPLLEALIP